MQVLCGFRVGYLIRFFLSLWSKHRTGSVIIIEFQYFSCINLTLLLVILTQLHSNVAYLCNALLIRCRKWFSSAVCLSLVSCRRTILFASSSTSDGVCEISQDSKAEKLQKDSSSLAYSYLIPNEQTEINLHVKQTGKKTDAADASNIIL